MSVDVVGDPEGAATPPGSMPRPTNEESRSTSINHPKWHQRQALVGSTAVRRSVATDGLPRMRRGGTTDRGQSGDPGTWPARSSATGACGARRATDAGGDSGATIPVPVRREHDGDTAGNAIAPTVHSVGDWLGAGAVWSGTTFCERGPGPNEPVEDPWKEGGRGLGDFATMGGGGAGAPPLPLRARVPRRFHGAASGRARGDDAGGARATDGAGRRNRRASVHGRGAGLVMAIVGGEIRR